MRIWYKNGQGRWYWANQVDCIAIAWAAVNPRHPFPAQLRFGAGSR